MSNYCEFKETSSNHCHTLLTTEFGYLKTELQRPRRNKLYFNKLASFLERAIIDTPPFFKQLRLIGLVAVTIGTTIMMAPIAVPAALTTIAGYVLLGGTVLTAISQVTINEE